MTAVLEDTMSDFLADPGGLLPEGADSQAVLQEIKRNCFLLSVTVHRWDGKYLVRGSTVHLANTELDDKLTTAPRWKLMPETWHKRIQPFVSQVRAVVYRVGVPFKDGVYIVPKQRARELMATVRDIRERYRSVAAEFVSAWPDIVTQLERKICREVGEEQWFSLSQKIPIETELLKLFDIEVGLWPIGGAGGGIPGEMLDSLDCLKDQLSEAREAVVSLPAGQDRSTLLAYLTKVLETIRLSEKATKKVLEENLEEWMTEAAETTSRMVSKAVETMLTDPIQEFAAAVQNLVDLQGREGRCRAGTLEAIRRAHAKLLGFQFMVPGDLIEKLRQVEMKLGQIEASDVNSKSLAARNLTEALKAISTSLQSSDTRNRGTEMFTRNIDI
jgi:Protein of unknown function (DUF3150)